MLSTIAARVAKLLVSNRWDSIEPQIRSIHRDYETRYKNVISEEFIVALIVAEDHRFFRHHGVDWVGIAGAAWRFVISRKLRGASTIDQQLVRVVSGARERTLMRKLREILLALVLEGSFLKCDIPFMYLLVAYFGAGMNGLVEACRTLDIDIRLASKAEAAKLVAHLKYPRPSTRSPRIEKSVRRRALYVLQRMDESHTNSAREGLIDEAIYSAPEL